MSYLKETCTTSDTSLPTWYRTTPLTCPAGAGRDELLESYLPAGAGAANCSARSNLDPFPHPFCPCCFPSEPRSRLLNRCPVGVDELPAPVFPDEHVGPAALLIYRPLLVLPFGGGSKGHDGGITVEADFDFIRDQRLEGHAAGLAVLQVLRPVLHGAAGAVMASGCTAP